MAASTIPNSGGPGSSIELSPMTIAVRDKVIEKFVDQPLSEMNESVKQLLLQEEDEQKRLGILAARVYILRQRIMSIAEVDPERVVTSASPKPKDLAGEEATNAGATETTTSEWKRLRILEDCEVNGVRFPKTVIIDVKSADAGRLVENGKAELIEESEPAPEVSEEETEVKAAPEAEIDTLAEDAAPPTTEMQPEDSASTEDQPEEAPAEPAADAEISDIAAEDPSAMLEALSDDPSAESEALSNETTNESVIDEQEDSSSGEAVIEAPSAAEVTAALEALGAGSSNDAGDHNEDEKTQDAADVAAELAALSATSDASDTVDETSGDAAEVAAALEAASAAMAAGPSNTDMTDLPAAGAEQDDAGSEKPAGWFEAQQNAEAAKRDEDKSDNENP